MGSENTSEQTVSPQYFEIINTCVSVHSPPRLWLFPILSFQAEVITHRMEAVISYFTDDATAERIDFVELDI